MIEIDGLIFSWKRFNQGAEVDVTLTCMAERGKSVSRMIPKPVVAGDVEAQKIAEAINDLTAWYHKHTRPPPEALNDSGHPEFNKRPMRAVGFLRPFTAKELEHPYYARARKVSYDDVKAGRHGEGSSGPPALDAQEHREAGERDLRGAGAQGRQGDVGELREAGRVGESR